MVMSNRWAAFPFMLVALLGSAAADDAAFDAARLKTSRFTYQDIQDGKPGSLSLCTVSTVAQGNYRFTCDFPAFDQSWSTVATRSMAPVETTLKMRAREGRHYQMTLTYTGHHVTGEAVTDPSADGRLPGSDRAVEADISEDTVDQRIDWATVMTTDLKPGQKLLFSVYDAKTGVSQVSCTIADAGVMESPLGKLAAIRLVYTVEKSTSTESYTVYATRDVPRMMLREDLPGGLTAMLVKVEP